MTPSNSSNSAAATSNGGAGLNQTADDVERRLATAVAATLVVRRANDAINTARSVSSPTESSVQRFMEEQSLMPVNTPDLSIITHGTINGPMRNLDVVTGGESHRRNPSLLPVIDTRRTACPSVVTVTSDTTDGV